MIQDKVKSTRLPQDKDGAIEIATLDMHTAGEPLRVVLDGFPEAEGGTILEKRAYVRTHFDDLRTALMFEPRGHADMYGCLIVEPTNKSADFGIIFMHNEGYSTMCGHATIAVTKLAAEMGWVQPQPPVTEMTIEAPCGLITSRAYHNADGVTHVEFENVPSFVHSLDKTVTVDGIGELTYDIAYGGAFYAIVNADALGVPCTSDNYQRFIDLGRRIKAAVSKEDSIQHPFESDLGFLYGTIFTGEPVSEDADSRNVCVFADGEVDRSPTGSGVSARMALDLAKGNVKVGETRVIESILGTTFTTWVKETCTYGPHDAVVPVVQGDAFITGRHTFYVDPEDPLKKGFIVR